jgi:nitroimidazol reductase NimA-like FMN-containing flavoprotein (pyridoxamine 5'-phosphate oxidase superfamily)
MEPDEGIRQQLHELLNSQKFAVLSTHSAGQPYASLVAFACDEDLRAIYFVTARSTRKFANLESDGRVALLVSSSANREDDLHAAMAATIVGRAAESRGPEREAALALYLRKHPWLEEFARAPTCALVKVAVRTFVLVKNFQHVMELHLEP